MTTRASELEWLKGQAEHWQRVQFALVMLRLAESATEIEMACEDLVALVPSVDVDRLRDEVVGQVAAGA